jgi:hypothetical protein
MVSGTISLPSRGTFHHSLTVLIRYRSPGSIQPYQVVLANSPQITGVRGYSRTIIGRPKAFSYRTLTLYGAVFIRLRLTIGFLTPGHVVSHTTDSLTTPHWQPLTGITPTRFRHPSAFARHYSRNHYCFLFLPVLRCFTSRRSLHTPYEFRCRRHDMTRAGLPHSETLGSQLG